MATQLKDLASVEKIIDEMSLEEKATLVIGGSPMSSAKMDKYGIPSVWTSDCCNGLNMFQYTVEKTYKELAGKKNANGEEFDREAFGTMGGLLAAVTEMQRKAKEAAEAGVSIPATHEVISYPTGISQASTWNPEIANECARTVAKEFVKYGIDLILSPNINIHRDPLCGRLTESYSEDPYLVSRIAEAVVMGLQDEGIISNPKHFAANSQEKDRLKINEKISMRALREIYLPAFKTCVDAGALTVMSAYNKINDESCAMNEWLLSKVLKEEWGFEGCVISDWGASYEQVPALAAGTDLTMPGPRGIKCIIDAVNNGLLDVKKLNDSCRRIMRVIVKSGMMNKKQVTFDLEEAKKVVEKAARDAMILLKNDNTLPIDKHGAKLCFYGKRSREFAANSEGSGKVPSSFITNPYDRAVELLGAENVRFEEPETDTTLYVAVVGADGQEGADRLTMDMDEEDKKALLQAITDAKENEGKLLLICNSSGPITLTDYLDDCDAVLCPFFAGQAGGNAVTDAILGLYNPSGKLTDTWPKEYCDTPAYKNYGGENKEVWYGEGIYVGYRWYDARKIEPQFPFGYGLSYTTFRISNLKAEDTNVDQEDIRISVDVENTGNMYGAEVVQLYIASPKTDFDKPEKELRGFKKVYLNPGERKNVSFIVKKENLAHYHTGLEEFVTEPGKYDILIGKSSRDIVLSKMIEVSCRDPFGWSVITGIGKLVTNPKAVEIINHAIDDNINLVAAVPIQYAPDYTLKELWETDSSAIANLFRKQGKTKEEKEAAWKYIIEEFKKL